MFERAVPIARGELVERDGFVFADLLLGRIGSLSRDRARSRNRHLPRAPLALSRAGRVDVRAHPGEARAAGDARLGADAGARDRRRAARGRPSVWRDRKHGTLLPVPRRLLGDKGAGDFVRVALAPRDG